VGIKHPTGKLEKTIVAASEPKSRVWLDWNDTATSSLDAERDAHILAMVLRIPLREGRREDMGGVYGVRVAPAISPQPHQPRARRRSASPNAATGVAAALSEIAEVANAGVTHG